MRVPGYLSPAQAAARLGVARRTVSNWAMDNLGGCGTRLRGVRRTPGGYVLIPKAEVDRILRERS